MRRTQCRGGSLVVVGRSGRVESFPLCPAVLKPDLGLDLGQVQLKRDLWPLKRSVTIISCCRTLAPA